MLKKPWNERNSSDVNKLKAIVRDNKFLKETSGIAAEDYKDLAIHLTYLFCPKSSVILNYGISNTIYHIGAISSKLNILLEGIVDEVEHNGDVPRQLKVGCSFGEQGILSCKAL